MLSFEEREKIAEIQSEQAKYKNMSSFDSLTEEQYKYNKENGIPPLTLDMINQYIKEVRDGSGN